MPALTSFRAVAALLVFVFHFRPQGGGELLEILCGQGHVGVTAFFVLSGFLITVRYFPAIARGEHRIGEYFVRRAARILPLYLFVFVLMHVVTRGTAPIGWQYLPEWTLTQALFGSSLEDLTVGTSWSLTVEECYYATAPLVFLAIARLSRRWGLAVGAALGLVGTTFLLGLAGAVVLQFSGPLEAAGMNFLANPLLLRSFTLFGRYADFAMGTAAGLIFLTGRVDALWRRPRGAAVSTLLALAGAGLVYGAQVGMVRNAVDPNALWRWNHLAAAGSTFIVLALTCGRAPIARLMSAAWLVYLGRVSYAFYLVHFSPLGNDLVFWSLPGDGVHLVTLYLGVTLVSALLFELVEEPARETLLALWRGRSLREPAPVRRRALGLSVTILLAVLVGQHAAWWGYGLEPPTEAALERALGGDSSAVLHVELLEAPPDGKGPRVTIPGEWLRGRPGKLHGPEVMLVYVDGRPVPFLGIDTPGDHPASAYYRWRRAPFLSLDVPLPARVTVVDLDLGVALALARARIAEDPLPAALPLLLMGGAGLLWWHRGGPCWSPRTSLAAGSALTFLWLVSEAYQQPWAPLLLAIEALVLWRMAFGAR
jgi:peptidoglycan/LPS O-acetylase OafA/YrhL